MKLVFVRGWSFVWEACESCSVGLGMPVKLNRESGSTLGGRPFCVESKLTLCRSSWLPVVGSFVRWNFCVF
jgi:hypothetical protein